MKGFCPLASGSKGNSIYFGSEETKILIDAGLSGRATKRRLEEIELEIEEIEAILITHDHTDHTAGLKMLALKHNIPILANAETAKGIYAQLRECPKFHIFTTGETFHFKDLTIHPFSIQHDTPDPVAFTIETEDLKMGFCTDLGFPSTLVKSQLKNCDYLYVEANHEPHMVHACSRPMVYKQRVLSRSGHLSNEACAELLSEIVHDELKHIYLAHLSQECNTPERALETVHKRIGDKIKISIAHQDVNSEPTHF
ncbi:MAG: MBL fold metallo-hydrolase [Chlamydiales bacterium]|nr:MBL fold metallo-hydrolase [Chlamydiales bacterium]